MNSRTFLRKLFQYTIPSFATRRRSRSGLRGYCDALEPRRLLSGNVTAALVSGTATITGDTADNAIQIGISNGSLVLTGLNGTTINNAATFTLAADTSTLAANLNIALGAGNDAVYVTEGVNITGNLTVNDVAGNSILAVRGATLTGNFSGTISGGALSLSLESSTISGTLTVQSGQGRDTISMLSSTIGGTTSLSTGGGEDQIVLDQVTLKSLFMATANQADHVALRQVTINGNLSVDLGRHRDFFSMQNVTISGNMTLNGRGGIDNIALQGTNSVAGTALMNGQGGRNRISISAGSDFNGGLKSRRFGHRTVDATNLDDVLNNPAGGLFSQAASLRANVVSMVGTPSPVLTTDTSSNANTIQSNGTLATRQSAFVVTGTTTPGSSITVDADGDGDYDDGTTTADANGAYSVSITLANGAQALKIKSTSNGASTTAEVPVYRVTGSLVRFATTLGAFDIELLDTAAPLTTANFKSYLTKYVNSIIHRSTDPASEGLSVIQGGGFVLNGDDLTAVATTAPVANEFNAANSNVRGTLALALPSGNIDGGTSQWFINLADNSGIDSGKYTVFGKVIGTGMTVVDAIHALSTVNLGGLYAVGGGALGTVPLSNYTEFGRTATGTVAVTAGSTSVTGTGSVFLTELAVGSVIQVNGVERTVTAIISDTQLTVDQAYTADATAVSVKTNVRPTASQFVRFTSITEVLPVA